MRGHQGDGVDQFVGADVVLVVLGAEAARGDARVGHLVVALGVEADRIGCAAAGDLGDEAGDGRAVGAAAEEARRGAAVELRGDGRAQPAAEVAGQRVEVGAGGLGELRRPPAQQVHAAVGVDACAVSGRQAVHAVERGARRRDHVEVEVVVDRLRGQRRRRREGGQLVGALGVVHAAVDDAPAQRALGEAVDCEPGAAAGVGGAAGVVAVDGSQRGGQVRVVVAAALEQRLPGGGCTLLARDARQRRIAKARAAEGEGSGRGEGSGHRARLSISSRRDATGRRWPVGQRPPRSGVGRACTLPVCGGPQRPARRRRRGSPAQPVLCKAPGWRGGPDSAASVRGCRYSCAGRSGTPANSPGSTTRPATAARGCRR